MAHSLGRAAMVQWGMVSSTAALSLLREATRTRREVVFFAKGHERRFSPHVLGTKDGTWRVFGWQSGGGSASTLKAGGDWRCFGVADLTNLRMGDQAWSMGDATEGYGLNCIELIDTAADLAYAAQSLQRAKRRPHQR